MIRSTFITGDPERDADNHSEAQEVAQDLYDAEVSNIAEYYLSDAKQFYSEVWMEFCADDEVLAELLRHCAKENPILEIAYRIRTLTKEAAKVAADARR